MHKMIWWFRSARISRTTRLRIRADRFQSMLRIHAAYKFTQLMELRSFATQPQIFLTGFQRQDLRPYRT